MFKFLVNIFYLFIFNMLNRSIHFYANLEIDDDEIISNFSLPFEPLAQVIFSCRQWSASKLVCHNHMRPYHTDLDKSISWMISHIIFALFRQISNVLGIWLCSSEVLG